MKRVPLMGLGIAVSLMIASIPSSARAQERHPFEGTWNANLSKSQRHENHPVPGAPGVVTVSKWATPHRLEIVAKKDGKVVGESRYEVSTDGKILTSTVKAIDASGRPFDQIIVFDRETK